MAWLPLFGIFNEHTDVDACDCTRGAVQTLQESALEVDWEKIPLPYQGLKPASVLHLDFQSNALPTDLSPLCLPVVQVRFEMTL